MNVGYRGYLAVNVWALTTNSFLPHSLDGMPRGSFLIVGKYRERLEDDIAQVGVKLGFALARFKAFASVGQLVPHHRCRRALKPSLPESLQNRAVCLWRYRCGQDTRIEQILERQTVTLRPTPRSRSDRK